MSMFKVMYKKINSNGKTIEFSDDSIFFPTKKDAQKFVSRLRYQAKKEGYTISAYIFEFENN